MSALLAGSLFAFGGSYAWAAGAIAGGALVLFSTSRLTFLAASDLRSLDGSLLIALAIGVLQMVPVPAGVLRLFSPSREPITGLLALRPPPDLQTVSINPAASAHALLVFGGALLVFWSARGLFRFGGIRTVTRGVAFAGLVAAALGILQDASRTRLVYWWWMPQSEGAPGFGPFINRNHFAAWAVMALSLTIGYIAARTHARDGMDRYRSFGARLRRRLDLRTTWLMLAVGLMTVALVLSLSRSGLAAGAVAVAAAHMMVAGRRRSARGWMTIGAGAALVVGVLWTGPADLVDRWRAAEIGQEGRSLIWRETMPVVRDFWLTGTGIGTYGDAMTVYQRSDRDRVHFNQAHNHYLQVLAEGGVLLFAACAASAALFVRAARRRLRGDHTGMLWLRIGAAAGLSGLAVSSIWETAARMPANALLASVLAAIVLHDIHHHGPRDADREPEAGFSPSPNPAGRAFAAESSRPPKQAAREIAAESSRPPKQAAREKK